MKSTDEFGIITYPNPITTSLNLDIVEITEEPITVELVNGFAQVLESYEIETGAKQFEINMQHIPNGVYFLHIKMDGKKPFTKRIIKADERF